MTSTKHHIPQGYILRNRVTHLRSLPVSSSHAFRYLTLSLLLSLDALESGKLDLASGWVFGYGGLWGRLLGLRSRPYLDTLSSLSIRQKLENELRRHYLLSNSETFEGAWMLTMPSILGNEGINPLTVYFCYKNHALWVAVFEIHNTFGESHIHLLEIGKNEDPIVPNGYDHQWTFRRQFHVSPFNDRSGYYRISIQSPGHPPMHHPAPRNTDVSLPLPSVWIRVYTDPDIDSNSTPKQKASPHPSDNPNLALTRPSVGELKLAAYLRPISALPFNTQNVIRELMNYPFALFLTMPRILYQAWVLHFTRRLDVFPRPEPHAFIPQPQSNNVNKTVPGGGVGWQPEGLSDSYARNLVIRFLKHRVHETGISVSLVPSNPNIAPTRILATEKVSTTKSLEISYLSSQFFTILLICPSTKHAFLLGSSTEGIFQVSSHDLFTMVFNPGTQNPRPSFLQEKLQRIRQSAIPDTLKFETPPVHYLDMDRPVTGLIMSTLVLWCLTLLGHIERSIFQLTGSRFIEGQEPWNAWNRAAELYSDVRKPQSKKSPIVHGSVRRIS